MADPVHELEHAHGELMKLVLEIRRLLHVPEPTEETHADLLARLEVLRDELLTHFANEEEGLFPFIRSNVAAKADVVDRMEAAHDTICDALVGMVHLAARDGATPSLVALYQRFESAHAEHSRQEAALLASLAPALTPAQRRELRELLRALE